MLPHLLWTSTSTTEAVREAGRIGASDCEWLLDDAFLAQPVNAVSSLAYVVAGLWVLAEAARRDGTERSTQKVFGAALVAVGVGSVAFHGPQPPGARLVHDLAIAAVFAVVAGRAARAWGRRPERAGLAVAAGLTVVFGVLMAIRPDAGPPATGALAVAAVAAEAWVHRTGLRLPVRTGTFGIAAGLAVAGAVVNALGRTDAPWCDPISLLQPHAAWHVLTAVALGLYGKAAFAADRRDGWS